MKNLKSIPEEYRELVAQSSGGAEKPADRPEVGRIKSTPSPAAARPRPRSPVITGGRR